MKKMSMILNNTDKVKENVLLLQVATQFDPTT